MAQAPHPEDNRMADKTRASAGAPAAAARAAQAEKQAGSRIPVGVGYWVLAACVVVYLIAMCLPFAAGVSGWQFVGHTAASVDAQAKVTEYVFAWLSCAGLGVLTTLALLTRRFAVAVPAWMLTTISLFASLLAIWLRRTSASFEQGLGHGPGIFLAAVAVLVATFAFIPVVTRRDEALREVGEQRARIDGTDAVARAQQDATAHAQSHHDNPLLLDDRRARAAERHRGHKGHKGHKGHSES